MSSAYQFLITKKFLSTFCNTIHSLFIQICVLFDLVIFALVSAIRFCLIIFKVVAVVPLSW